MNGGAKFLVKAGATVKKIKVLPTNRVIESRMALKLEDLIGKKKEVNQVLDLSKSTVNSDEEFKRLMEKVPEFRIKPEKIRPEDIKIQDGLPKRRSRSTRRKSPGQGPRGQYQFADPIPEEMRSVKLEDLCPVNIQWNMLTTLRPKSKADTEYFSRLVELGKLALATQEKEKKTPVSAFLRKMKNRAGVVETRFTSCQECSEEFCQKEACTLFQYEDFRREPMIENIGKKEETVEKRPRNSSKTKKRSKTRGSGGGTSTAVRRSKSKTAANKTADEDDDEEGENKSGKVRRRKMRSRSKSTGGNKGKGKGKELLPSGKSGVKEEPSKTKTPVTGKKLIQKRKSKSQEGPSSRK